MLVIWGRTNSINVQKVLWCCEELALEYRELAEIAALAGNRRNIDDGAAAVGAHQSAGFEGHREGADEIDVEDFAEQLDAGLEERHIASDAG